MVGSSYPKLTRTWQNFPKLTESAGHKHASVCNKYESARHKRKSACNKYESAGHKRNSATNTARTIEKLLK